MTETVKTGGFEFWKLDIGIYLVLGIWNLVFKSLSLNKLSL
jgi:hypothetical protein